MRTNHKYLFSTSELAWAALCVGLLGALSGIVIGIVVCHNTLQAIHGF